jgi:hypothetical protein
MNDAETVFPSRYLWFGIARSKGYEQGNSSALLRLAISPFCTPTMLTELNLLLLYFALVIVFYSVFIASLRTSSAVNWVFVEV